MSRNAIVDCLRDQLPDLRNRFGVKRIGLFGSVLRGPLSKQSDIDLIVEFDHPIGFAFFDLIEHLEGLLGRRVDILTPDGVASIRIPEVAETISKSVVYV